MEASEIKTAIDAAVNPFMRMVEEFKAENNARLTQIEKKGAADVLTEEKLTRLEGGLANYEGLNQRLVLAEQQAKALKEVNDKIEVAIARIPANDRANKDGVDIKTLAGNWARAVVRANAVGILNLDAEETKILQDVTAEAKALSVSVDSAGGYLAPMEYVREIIKGVTELSPVRSLVRVRTTTQKTIQIPKRTGQFAATWVAEQGTRAETTGLSYGLEDLPVHEMYALIDVSNQMLEDSAFDMEAELRFEASEQFALAEGTAVVSGSGVGKPEGVLSASGIAETNSGSATAVAADGLISLFHGIKTAYSRNATWGLNRTTLGSIRKLKGSDNNYLWMPGLSNGVPNTILGAPYVEMPDMPNEGAGTYPVVFGDWRRGYVLVDRVAMEMLRDPYTQATSGNIRFIFRRRLGGHVVLSEAFRKMKCST